MSLQYQHHWLNAFEPALRAEIIAASKEMLIPAGTLILEQGKHVPGIPVVSQGTLRVFVKHEEKDLLLYYVKSNESCIMSFAACLDGKRSSVYAQTLDDVVVLLLPAELVTRLAKSEPGFNLLFHQQYQIRYQDLLDTISSLVFTNLDERLVQFLKKNAELSTDGKVRLSHREIAQELGTAREVVSRILKRLEKEGKLKQAEGMIEINV